MNERGGDTTILVVSNHATTPAFVAEMARSLRHRLLGRVGTVDDAVDAVRRRRPDVLLVDVAGIDVVNELVEVGQALSPAHLVVVTGLPDDVVLLPSMAVGVRAYLRKPVEAGLLEHAVSAAAGGDVFVDPRSVGRLVDLALYGHRARPDSGLTLRQSQVLQLVRAGLTNREIAHTLGVSLETVRTHLQTAVRRLGARNRTDAAERVVSNSTGGRRARRAAAE